MHVKWLYIWQYRSQWSNASKNEGDRIFLCIGYEINQQIYFTYKIFCFQSILQLKMHWKWFINYLCGMEVHVFSHTIYWHLIILCIWKKEKTESHIKLNFPFKRIQGQPSSVQVKWCNNTEFTESADAVKLHTSGEICPVWDWLIITESIYLSMDVWSCT